MHTQIDTAMKRARGYWFVDGFAEIATGVLLAILAGFIFINRNTSQTPFPSWLLSVAGEISIMKMVSLLIAILVLWWLKNHFTYPRTGYVRNQITAVHIFVVIRNVILFLLLPIVGLLIVSLLMTSTSSVLSSLPVWFPIGLGLLWAVLIMMTGEWLGLRRFRLLGGLILLTGIVVGIWQFTMGLPNIPANVQPAILQPSLLESLNRAFMSLSLILLVSGIMLIISGALTFLRYRKENPQPYSEEA